MMKKKRTHKGNRRLEKVLHEHPEDLDTWSAYGKWLLSKGDPRGEAVLIGVSQAKDGGDRQLKDRWDEILSENQETWLGPELLAGLALENQPGLEIKLIWKFGFIYSAKIHTENRDFGPRCHLLLSELLEGFSSRFLSNLTISGWFSQENNYKKCLELISKGKARPSLREFCLGESDSDFKIGDLGPVLLALPGLVRFVVYGKGIFFNPGNHRKLELVFIRDCGSLQIKLTKSKMPRLRKLDMHFNDCNPAINFEYLFNVKHYPVLRQLVLKQEQNMDDMVKEVIKAIRNSSGPLRLEVLDLTDGKITDQCAQYMLDGRDVLNQLKRIKLKGEYFISENYSISPKMFNKLASVFAHKVELPEVDKNELPYTM